MTHTKKHYPLGRIPKPLRLILAALLLLLTALLIGRTILHRERIQTAETQWIYLPEGSTYADLTDSLAAHGCLHNRAIFDKLAQWRGLTEQVRPGCYKLTPEMSVATVIQKFYHGNQDPIRITINKHRTKQSLVNYLDKRLALSGDSLLMLMNDPVVTEQYGHSVESIIGMFPQNTYEVYWTISPRALLDRMEKESKRFWTSVRRGQCDALGLSQREVITLASIVEEESNQNEEKPLIASVYLNRLKRGMALQADPTVRFAYGDFSVRRIVNKMLKTDSPYNTYLYPGLPPGPICIPSSLSVDAVLSGVQTNYLYFCAKEDFSGYHNFAATLAEHQQNARRFHQALNKRNIRR